MKLTFTLLGLLGLFTLIIFGSSKPSTFVNQAPPNSNSVIQNQQKPDRQKPDQERSPAANAAASEAVGDPDLPPGASMDKETYLELRNEYIAMLRGYLPDQPFDPTARGRAIAEMESKERELEEAKISEPGPKINADTWTAIGPAPIPSGQTFGGRSDPVSGRTIAIAVHPTNPNIVYVGTAAGGVYRSLDGGANWTPIFDSAQSLAVDAIAIAPSQPSTVYVGTGEIINFFGVGVYRIDNADSANPTLVGPINPVTDQGNGINTAAFQQTAISEILVHPTNPATIFVSTAQGFGGIVSGNLSFPNSRALFGVYRSTNATSALGSITFTKLTVNTNGGFSKGDTEVTDMAMEPDNPNTILCWVNGPAMSGGGGVYRSTNALATSPVFSQTHVSITDFARGELAINKNGGTQVTTVLAATGEAPSGLCPANQNGRLRRSTDGGQTWSTSLSGGDGFCGGQCFYDIAVEMNQTSANPTIHIGGSADYNTGDCAVINKRSLDGGSTFAKNEIGLHPDVHVVAVAPSNQSIVYTGNDGGIWKSTDGGATWTTLNNSDFNATQFVSMALHPTDREYMTGGTQDNGTEFRRANGTWTQIALGDGGYTLIDRNATDTTNVTIYHTYYNRKNVQILFQRVTTTADAEAKNWVTRGALLDANKNCTSNNGINCSDTVLFYAPMALGPGNPNTLYFGTDRLYRSTNRGDSMTVVGSVGAISASPIASISISPQNDNVRLVGLRNGEVWATTSGGTLTNVTPANAPAGIPVGKVLIDPTNANTAYVTYGGFGVTAGRHIFKSTNLNAATPSWAASSSGIPDVPVDAFTVDRLAPQNLYAGTDIGVYRSTDGGSSWTPFNGGLPRIPVFDIAFQEQGQTSPNSTRVLRIATHGRGIWEIQIGAGGCSYSLNPTSQNFGSSGGNGSFGVTASPGCAWSAVSNASWITTSSSGSGTGTVNFSVASNTSAARTGTISVASQTFTVNQSAGSGGCPSTTITAGQTINGTLTTSDCIFTGTTRYVDVYNFSGTAGQAVVITMNSSAFDTYLYLLDAGNQLIAEDDDGNGGTNSRIPTGGGSFNLPSTGSYTIYATSYASDSTGNYSLTLSAASNCNYSLNPTSQIFIASASNGSFSVSTGANCPWTATSNASWLTTTSSGSGPGTVNYGVAANTGNARTGTITVAAQTFTVFQSAGNGNGCPVTNISIGQTINTTLTTGCVFTGTSRYVDPYDFNGVAGQQIVISMNSSSFDTYLFLNDPTNHTIAQDDDGGGGTNSRIPPFGGTFALPSTGTYRIFATSYSVDGTTGSTGPYSISLQGAGGSAPANNNFANAQTVSGLTGAQTGTNAGANKESGEPNHGGNSGGASVWYRWQAPSTGLATFTTTGSDFDTLLGVYTGTSVSALTTLASNDDDPNGGLQSRVSFSATAGVTYYIAVDGYNGATGNIILNWTSSSSSSAVQFSSSAYSVSEGNATLTVTVTRSGSTSSSSTVDYVTSDTAGLQNCTLVNGQAPERCDYVTAVGTVRFAAGETSKTFTVSLINDVLVEGNETFTVSLRNPVGAMLGTPSSATITINDNDTVTPTSNPIDGVEFFIRQQYRDFLNREPDATGLQNWVNTLSNCPNGGFGEPPTSDCDRLHVAAGFFQSDEFLNRGYWAFRFYMTSFQQRPTYAQFIPDMAQVGGPKSPAEEEAAKAAFADAFVQRSAFTAKYGSLSGQALANALTTNAGLPSYTVTAGQTNGQILRAIAERQTSLDKFLTEGTVSILYFGFQRRDPDTIGYQNNLATLNANPTNLRHMIFIFIYSTEYRQRFGPP